MLIFVKCHLVDQQNARGSIKLRHIILKNKYNKNRHKTIEGPRGMGRALIVDFW